jgi:hypothetical protein
MFSTFLCSLGVLMYRLTLILYVCTLLYEIKPTSCLPIVVNQLIDLFVLVNAAR